MNMSDSEDYGGDSDAEEDLSIRFVFKFNEKN